MAKHLGVSKATVQRVWSTNDIKPHRTRIFKLSCDEQFEAKFWGLRNCRRLQHSSYRGQLFDAQTSKGSSLAAASSALSSALHTHQRFLDEHGRTFLPGSKPASHPAR